MMHDKGMRTIFLLALALGLAPTLGRAQGSLTPPGAPAPVMKTLDQVQPLIPIDAAHTPGSTSSTFVISQPGSYYLTGNLKGSANKHVVEIAASNVTLDLKGFNIDGYYRLVMGPSPSVLRSGNGIYVTKTGIINITIKNGSVTGSGINGIDTAMAKNVILENLQVSTSRYYGFNTGQGGVIKNCIASENGYVGFLLGKAISMSGCMAMSNGMEGIVANQDGCTITDCSMVANSRSGIYAGRVCTVTQCVASSNSLMGFQFVYGGLIRGCTASNNKVYGMSVIRTTVSQCTVVENQATGLNATNSIIEGCSAANNNYGIIVEHSTVRDCNVLSNNLDGIQVFSNCQILRNNCAFNGRSGIRLLWTTVTLGRNRIEGNTMTDNNHGLYLESGNMQNQVLSNVAGHNSPGGNYTIPPADSNLVAPFADTSAELATADNAYTNLSY